METHHIESVVADTSQANETRLSSPCGLHGTVEAPASEEWRQAFHAPSRPFQWLDETRNRK